MKQVSPDQQIDAIRPARIEWRDGVPFSTEFNDVYFSRAGGLDETNYVFLQHNRLQARFGEGNQPFVIAETGFGTGLNFLCAWHAFITHASTGRRLHFISAEKFPLQKSDLLQAHASWPTLQALSAELAESYPALTPGFHRLVLHGGRVHLTLLFGDAAAQFAQLNAEVDAWFLDGFAPAHNPELWQTELLRQMHRLSIPGRTTFATFTAASWVRKALQEQGFRADKAPGYGRKRDMLHGVFEPVAVATPGEAAPEQEPWFRFTAPAKPARAVVIGAGLAGAATAAALADRGVTVTLLERHEAGSGASGNAQGVIFTKLSPYNTPQTRFYQQSYLYACRQLARVLGEPDGLRWQACGMLQLAFDEQERNRQRDIQRSGLWPASLARPMNAEEASDVAGLPLPSGGLFFPDSGWVHPPALVQAYLSHPGIRVVQHTPALSFSHQGGVWQIVTPREMFETECLILANSHEALQFPQLHFLPLNPIRGQVSQVTPTALSESLKTLLLYEGYLTPARGKGAQARHCIGASFVPKCASTELRAEEDQSNLDLLNRYLQPPLFGSDNLTGARAAVRSQPNDYLPALGPVPDEAFFLHAYARLRTGNFRQPFPPGVYLPGLYLNLGHGSRGITTTSLSAEYLASLICHEPWPIDQQLAHFLNPARFLIRALKRRSR